MRRLQRSAGSIVGVCLAWFATACKEEPPPPPPERAADEVLAASRASCEFARGAVPFDTVGREFPIGADIPIDHFIILMQENRSFDHYFGMMPGVDGIPAGASNPDAMGAPVEPFHETLYCIEDVAHSWNASHEQFNGGANDGFVITNDPGGARALGYYDESDLGYYWSLYQTFAMSDHHFCSVLGPTWPNRFYFLGASSRGLISNVFVPNERLEDEPFVIFQELDTAGVSWKVYFSDLPFILGGYPSYTLQHSANVVPIEDFFADLAAGTLPSVVYLDPSFMEGVEQTDEHPPADMQMGQAWVAEVIDAVMTSSIWERSAIILTYDEHGGYYDHVPPPEACHPNDFPADIAAGDVDADFDRLGFRVPLVIVSPYSKAGYVSDRVTDLTSVLRLLEARYELPALSDRDANAWPLLDMFDFENPPFMTPPPLVPPVIDATRLAECHVNFPN